MIYYAIKGDEKTELYGIRRTFYEELPEKEKEIKERIYDSIYGSSDQHTIMIIAGKGTDYEKVYTETANADVYLDVWIKDSEGNYNLYLDSEYKEPYPYDGEYEVVSFDADKTIYMK